MNRQTFTTPQLIIFILALAVVVGGYFAFGTKTQAPAPQPQASTSIVAGIDMNGWQTYTNSQYGFEMEYPSGYSAFSYNAEKQGFYDYQISKMISKIVSLSAKENYIDDSAFTVYADNGESNLKECGKDSNGNDLTQMENINGADYYVFWNGQSDAAMGGARGLLNQYRIVHNGYCYILDSHVYWHQVGYAGVINTGKSDATPEETQAQNDAIERHTEVLKQILSTFKFISP